jgi:hypothetical protein
MKELLRVVKSGGIIILGVMSRFGSMQRLVNNFTTDLIEGKTTIQDILKDGNDMGYLAFEGHHHHLFTSEELKQFLSKYPLEILEMTATSYLTMPKGGHFKDIARDQQAWNHLFDMELEICKQIVDGGSHMLAIVKRQ